MMTDSKDSQSITSIQSEVNDWYFAYHKDCPNHGIQTDNHHCLSTEENKAGICSLASLTTPAEGAIVPPHVSQLKDPVLPVLINIRDKI